MSEGYDILIRNGTIVDGTGKPALEGSVAIRGEEIAGVGDIRVDAARTIDAQGLVVCPGFVDPHNHGDNSILEHPRAENLVMQGITTIVGGNCGFSLGPIADKGLPSVPGEIMSMPDPDWRSFGEWLSLVEDVGPTVNYVPLVGHNTVRAGVMGEDFRRAASVDEVERMKPLVEEAMQSGAFGLSAGLDMPWHGYYADREETIALAKIAREHGGLFAPHTRHLRDMWATDEPTELLYSVFYGPKGETITGRYHGLLEAVEIGKRANGIPVHIAHLAVAYITPQPHPEFLDEAVARATLAEIVDKPRDEGLDVTFNVIASVSSITGQQPMLDSFFNPHGPPPQWLEEIKRSGKQAFVEQLKTPSFREKMKSIVYSGRFKFGMIHPLKDPYWMDCYRVLQCKRREYVGKTIGQIVRGRQPLDTVQAVYETSLEVLFDILVEDPDATWVRDLDKRQSLAALSVFLKHPAGMPCTDVDARPALAPEHELADAHGITPTAYSLYPQYINTFVKERAVLSLEEAIKKATSVPAQAVVGLTDRGIIREGAYADIVIFDLERISDAGDFLEPTRPPQGIKHVLVNGTVVYENMAHTGAKPGKVLRHT